MKARECERHGLATNSVAVLRKGLQAGTGIEDAEGNLGPTLHFFVEVQPGHPLHPGREKEVDLSDSDKTLCAGIYMRMGQYSRATEFLESVANKQKEEYYMLGLLYESLGNIPKALVNYKGFLKKDPSSIDMTLKVGSLYARLKEYGAAESLFVAAGKNNGQNPRLFNAIGEVKLAKGDIALSRLTFSKWR